MSTEITLKVEAAGLISAIETLASALSAKGITSSEPAVTTQPPTQITPVTPSVQAVPVSVPIQPPTPNVEQTVPATPAPSTAAAVPTQEQTYTMEQLAIAGTQLVDAGRMEELKQVLAAFGVHALTELPKENYGAFATQLRSLGAKI